jgi:hypothetical protein
MAYGKRIYGQIAQSGTDLQIDVEIHQNLYTGAATEILLGYPAFKTRMGNAGDKYKIIKGEEIDINIAVQDGDDFSFLYTNDDRKFKVIIKLNSIIWWSGFVLVDQFQGDFNELGFLTIIANDQVGMLDVRPYTFGSPAVSPTGYQKIIKILANALSKTALGLNIRVASNLFETTMTHADTDDPFDQASESQDRWINDDMTPDSCKTVIEDILAPMQCRILQSQGRWWIQRVPELADVSIDYREFDSAGDYVGQLSYNPMVDSDDLTILSGGVLEYESGWKERNIEVNYGLKSSLIPSFSFPDSVFTGEQTVEGWTNTGDWWRIRWKSGSASGNAMGAETGGRTAFDAAKYMLSPHIDATVASELSLKVNCGRIKAATKAKSGSIFIGVKLDDGVNIVWYREISESWGSQMTLSSINFPIVNSENDLVEQAVTIKNIPANGELTIYFYSPWRVTGQTVDNYFHFSDVRITGSISSVVGDKYLDGQTFNDFITDNTNFIPDDFKIRISDGLEDDTLLPYYKGFIKVGSVGSRTWIKKSLIGTGTPMPLISHSGSVWGQILDSWWWQYSSSNKRFKGSLWGSVNFHNTIYIHNIAYRPELDTVFMLDDVEIDLCDNIIEGDLIEIKPETPGAGGGTLSLKSRGLPGSGTPTSSGLASQPGGLDGQLQLKSGGDFEGTPEYTYADGRILKNGVAITEAHAGTFNVAAGPVKILFPTTYLETDEFVLQQPINGKSADGELIQVWPYDIDITGFYVNFPVACTGTFQSDLIR